MSLVLLLLLTALGYCRDNEKKTLRGAASQVWRVNVTATKVNVNKMPQSKMLQKTYNFFSEMH